jgi:periplasmic divalent cation tolerance protein
MKAGKRFRLVLVTCGSRVEARRIARRVVKARLAACVNILTAPVESIYSWKGKLKTSRESLLLIKTSANRLADLEREIRQLHSYQVPEFLVLPVSAGSGDYLQWLGDSVGAGK